MTEKLYCPKCKEPIQHLNTGVATDGNGGASNFSIKTAHCPCGFDGNQEQCRESKVFGIEQMRREITVNRIDVLRLPNLPNKEGWYWGHKRDTGKWLPFHFYPDIICHYMATENNPYLDLTARESCLIEYDAISDRIEPPQ